MSATATGLASSAGMQARYLLPPFVPSSRIPATQRTRYDSNSPGIHCDVEWMNICGKNHHKGQLAALISRKHKEVK